LIVSGEVDLATAAQFADAVHEASRSHSPLVIDLTRVEMFTCAGIRPLYAHVDQLAAVLVAPRSIVARALGIAGFPALVVVPPKGPRAGQLSTARNHGEGRGGSRKIRPNPGTSGGPAAELSGAR
jgi:anti-anti-sigma factor